MNKIVLGLAVLLATVFFVPIKQAVADDIGNSSNTSPLKQEVDEQNDRKSSSDDKTSTPQNSLGTNTKNGLGQDIKETTAISNDGSAPTVIGAFMSAFRGENGNYVNALLSTESFEKEVNKSLGATINQITGKNFSMMNFLTPRTDEQEKIGAFFKQLDNLITLHQRKVDFLKEQKKGFLQKMFPKNGQLVPEVRFAGFADDWEQREFGEVVTRVSRTSKDEDLPRVEYEDIVSGQGVLNKNIFEKDSRKQGIEFKNGDTLFGKLRPYLQNWLLADFNGIAVGDWWVLRSNVMDNKFVYSLIQTSKYQTVSNLSTGTKMPRSDWKVVSKTEFDIPVDKNEQEKIGMFFANIDNLITLHQRKLNLLKEQKKGFLQKMFVS